MPARRTKRKMDPNFQTSASSKLPFIDNCGTTTLESTELNYIWTIPNFSNLYFKEVDEIKSKSFCSNGNMSGASWLITLKFGPNQQENIQLELKLLNNFADIKTHSLKAEVSIVNTNLGIIQKETNFIQENSILSEKWVIPNFISKRVLMKNVDYFLPGNVLTIFCQIWYSGLVSRELRSEEISPLVHRQRRKITSEEYQNKQKEDFVFDDQSHVLQDYTNLFENPVFTDASIDVQGRIFKIHKAIVSTRCSVFSAMFNPQNEMREQKTNFVEIKDISPKVFRELLRYLYSGEVRNIEEIVSDLLVAADKYCLDELKSMCEKIMTDSTNVKNAMEFLGTAEKVQNKKLKQNILRFIKDNSAEILETNNLDAADFVSEILKMLIPE